MDHHNLPDVIILKDVLPKDIIREFDFACVAAFEEHRAKYLERPTAGPEINLGALTLEFAFERFAPLLLAQCGKDMLSRLNATGLVMLKTFHSIRFIEDSARRQTGIHYDFQVSNVLENAVSSPAMSYTCWLPTTSIDRTKSGLIVFDNDVTLLDIHRAAGEQGYMDQLDFVTCAADNKQYTNDPKYKKYIRPEDKMHVVDILADVVMDEKDIPRFREIHRACMHNMYANLKGRYTIPELDAGDLLMFNSNCYHGTYIPDNPFGKRINLDFRLVCDFVQNDETEMFEGLYFERDDEGRIRFENKPYRQADTAQPQTLTEVPSTSPSSSISSIQRTLRRFSSPFLKRRA